MQDLSLTNSRFFEGTELIGFRKIPIFQLLTDFDDQIKQQIASANISICGYYLIQFLVCR